MGGKLIEDVLIKVCFGEYFNVKRLEIRRGSRKINDGELHTLYP
jgi:hypothetical protein